MLNKSTHQLIMGQLLKDIYGDPSLAPVLGFKGGTCAYFFYNLPRFSVDLDFDLLMDNETSEQAVFEKVLAIAKKYGEIKDSQIKHFTIFLSLSYGPADHNIKIEINTRNVIDARQHYELKEHLGISLLGATQEYLFAGKLVALTARKEFAMRDVYDICFFTKQKWDIAVEVVEVLSGRSIGDQLAACISRIEGVKDNRILHGLGELIDDSEKLWVKQHLKTEALFGLKNYLSVHADA